MLASIFQSVVSGAKKIDWILYVSASIITILGIITMNSFGSESRFFDRQIIWFGVSSVVFFVASQIDWRFLKRPRVVFMLYLVTTLTLSMLFVAGSAIKGAKSWFNFGFFSFQPVDIAKIVVVIIMSKYFSRRHIEIAHIGHILISGVYVFSIFTLVFLQPDFGSAVIIFLLWLGMILVSGISKKHLVVITLMGVVAFAGLWLFAFKPYQKARIMNFVYPSTNIRGTGYNAFQSIVAVGSGELLGKGIGYGTQSKLQFLPEFQTDFIFAAFSEEWGFVGVMLLFILFGIVFWRVLRIAAHGGSNFEILFGVGVALFLATHTFMHIGMNIGLLPVTGHPLPFMSYGGSHLINEFLALGILMGMKQYSRPAGGDLSKHELTIS